jgi:hypothetical protein
MTIQRILSFSGTDKHLETGFPKNTGGWNVEETERIVAWLEEPANLRRTQKGSGKKKLSWLKSIVTQIPTRTLSQVTYKYDNLKRAHRDAVQLANSSGWGLDESTLREGMSSICGMYFS